MRLTTTDPSNPNVPVTLDYPDAPMERLATWLLAIPLWQRTREQVERRIGDFRVELDTLRRNGTAKAPNTAGAFFPHGNSDIGTMPTQSGPVPVPAVAVAEERPYTCEVCGAGFKLAMHLGKHQKAKHAAVPA